MNIPVSRFLEGQQVIRHPQVQETPLISVCMPTCRLRPEGSNQRAIESVLEQSFTNFEFIIVDDGSLDGLYEILLDYQKRDSRIVVIRHEINSGLPGLRLNEALLLARGKFIAYMFEDDEWYSNALEDLVNTALQQTEDCAVYGVVDWIIHKPNGMLDTRKLGDWDFNYGLLKNQNQIANCAVLHTRATLNKSGLYDPHVLLRRYCDYDLWLRMARQVPFIRCNALVGKVVSATTHSIGSNVDHDLIITSRLLNSERDEILLPQNFHKYKVDELAPFFSQKEKHRIRERYIIPFWQQHPAVLQENERKKILASKRKPDHLVVTKADYSTSVDVTLGNFSKISSDSEFFSFAFIQEKNLSVLNHWNYDTLVLYRTIGTLSLQALQRSHKWGKTTVYMMDDNMFKFGTGYLAEEFTYLKPESPAYQLLEKEVADVDLVISYSPNITRDSKKYNPRVIELSTNILEQHINDSYPLKHRNLNRRRIKYAVLTGTARKKELYFLWEVISEFSRNHCNDIEFYFFGIDPSDFGILSCPVYYIPFTHSYDAYIQSIKSEKFDYILCPLFDDHDTKLSKSPIKYLEATVAGSVGIYSDISVYEIVKEKVTGLKTSNLPEKWMEVLEASFYLDDEIRENMHTNAKSHILQSFTSESQILKHLSAFEAAHLHHSLSSRLADTGKAKIAYFFHEGLLGGATLHLMQHALILKQYGFSPIFCFVKDTIIASEVFEFATKHDIPIEFLKYTRYTFGKRPTRDDLRYVSSLKKWMFVKKIKLVHCVTYMPAIALSAYELGIPHLATLHQFYENSSIAPMALDERFVSAIHSSSLYYADKWQSFLGSPAFCIRAPVDKKYFEEYFLRHNRAVSDIPTILISGTIQPRKGQLNAVKAIASLKEKGIFVKLILLGYDYLSPDYVEECRNVIKKFKLQEQVIIPGFTSSPKEYYDQSDFILCSSNDESMPQSILKGMASGIRIITTPVGGVKELIVDGFSGIVTSGYEVVDLENAILRAIQTTEVHWRAMISNAHLSAQMSCSEEVVANKLLSLYNIAVDENVLLNSVKTKEKHGYKESFITEMFISFLHMKNQLVGKLKKNNIFQKIGQRLKKTSLHKDLNPIFQNFLDDSYLYQDIDGCVLRISVDLKDVEYISYKIEFKKSGNLSEISIAPILDANLRQGTIGIEIVSPFNKIIKQEIIPAFTLKKDTPTKFILEPALEIQKGIWEMRFFAKEIETPVRLFEWHKYLNYGLGKLEKRIFASFKFDN